MQQVIGIKLAHHMLRNMNDYINFLVNALNIQRYKVRVYEEAKLLIPTITKTQRNLLAL